MASNIYTLLDQTKDLGKRVTKALSGLEQRIVGLEGSGFQTRAAEIIKVNGKALPMGSDKSVNIPIPTNVSELRNDALYLKKAEAEAIAQAEVAKSGYVRYKIVPELPDPAEADEHIWYLLYNPETEHFDIYALFAGEMVWLDDTTIDLSDFYHKGEVDKKIQNSKYTLPAATADTLGGVMLGDNLTGDAEGKISLTKENVVGALGYTPGNAGEAKSVNWNDVEGKPSSYPPAGHTHDDRYYTESEMNTKLAGKSDTGHSHDLSALINGLSTGDATPGDADYYVSQYANGGTTNTSYHRRRMSALWNYIKGKTDSVYLKLSGGAITGQIKRSASGSWIKDRDNAVVQQTAPTANAYGAVVCMGTNLGTWTMGNLNPGESLIFNYVTNANVSANNNTGTQVSLPAQAGTIITSATIGSQTVNMAKKVLDSNNSTAMTFAYSKSGMNYGDYTWLAAWNGYELRAVNKSQFAAASHTHAYLPTAGGTMSGGITFSSIGDTNTSSKITWSGSTDGADIYYQTTASDQGNLVLNLRDDSNCYLRIAYNGSFKSYFSPADGNFHGNVNGNASTATTAAKLGRGGATETPMTFNWSGQSGQPSWLWGGNDGTNMYVYNPSNFKVNYASSAGAVAWGNVTGKPSTFAPSTPTATTTGAFSGVQASGSNYVRFTDGTQICWGSIVTKTFTVNGTYYNDADGWNNSCTANARNTRPAAEFAQAFVNTSYSIVLNTSYSVLSDINTFASGSPATYNGHYLQTVTSVSPALGKQTTYCVFAVGGWGFYVAIGRWK